MELLHFTIVEARIDADALGELEAIRAEAIVNAPSVTNNAAANAASATHICAATAHLRRGQPICRGLRSPHACAVAAR